MINMELVLMDGEKNRLAVKRWGIDKKCFWFIDIFGKTIGGKEVVTYVPIANIKEFKIYRGIYPKSAGKIN